MDNGQPIFESPITTSIAQPVAQGADLIVQDMTGVPIILIQGSPGNALGGLFATIPDHPGATVDTGNTVLARLTPDELYVFGKSPGAELPQAVDVDPSLAAAGQFSHATDLTHGKAVVKLAGPVVRETLSKLCGLNFATDAFPSGQVRQTSAAKIKTLIVRADEDQTPVYFLHVERSLGQYFWETLIDAGQEFGIASTG
jgi:heterotetrameric sarcosine oxidase gamma subunit